MYYNKLRQVPDDRETVDEIEMLYRLTQQRIEASLNDPTEDCPYPNHIVDVEQLIVNEDFIDRNSLTPDQRRASRSSILDMSVLATLRNEQAAVTASRDAVFKQVLLFVVAVIIMSATSSIDSWALKDSEGVTIPRASYIPRMIPLTSYICSVTFATISSPMLYGFQDLLSLWSGKKMIAYMPIAMAFCLQDVASITVTQLLGATMWKIMGQSKLILSAVAGKIGLQRDQSITCWLLLTTVSLSITSYSLQSIGNIVIKDYSGIIVALAALVLTTIAGLFSEMVLKKEKAHFIVQFGRTRICGLFGAIIFLFFELRRDNQWHLFPYGGWNAGHVIMVITDLARCWMTTFIVKQLDTTWKTLASALSLNGTYLIDLYLCPRTTKWSFSNFIIIMAICIDIIAYASAKKDEMKILQLASELVGMGKV